MNKRSVCYGEELVSYVTAVFERARRNAIVKAAGGLAGGAGIILLIESTIYALMYLAGFLPVQTQVVVLVLIIPLLFLANGLIEPKRLKGTAETRKTAERIISFYNPFFIMHACLMFIEFLLSGPRLILLGIGEVRRARRLKHVGCLDCAEVIAALLNSENKVATDDIVRNAAPIDAEKTFDDLRMFPGVLFVESVPPAMAITKVLRESLIKALRPDVWGERPSDENVSSGWRRRKIIPKSAYKEAGER